jgi:DNA polymerase III delta prime subunit
MIAPEELFKFWQTVEALTPQKAEKPNPPSSYAIKTEESLFPWKNSAHLKRKLLNDKTWSYILQCGIYETSVLADLLEEKIGAHKEVYDERREHGQSRLFDIEVNDAGYPNPDKFTLSLACWAAGQILHHEDGIKVLQAGGMIDCSDLKPPAVDSPRPNSGYWGFDELSQRLQLRLTEQVSSLKEKGTPPDRAWFDEWVKYVMVKCYLPETMFGQVPVYMAKCLQVSKPQKGSEVNAEQKPDNRSHNDDTMLNSFFIEDLRRVDEAWKGGQIGRGFREYITAVGRTEESVRTDLRTKEGRQKAYCLLMPDRMPEGRWPSDHPLVFSQQLAVNEIWNRLKDNSGIFAVNGPPGTGKTTLLRDIVAAVIVDRAKKIIELTEKRQLFKAQENLQTGNSNRNAYYPIADAVQGSAIVVASANNGAVENISLELPGKDAVPERISARSNYFKELATIILGKEAWGLLAARLGNKSNRSDFVAKFFQYKPPDDHPQKRGILDLNQPGNAALEWQKAVERFDTALKEEGRIRAELKKMAELPERIRVTEEKQREAEQRLRKISEVLLWQKRMVEKLTAEAERAKSEHDKLAEEMEKTRLAVSAHDESKPSFLDRLIRRRKVEAWQSKRAELDREVRENAAKLQGAEKARDDVVNQYNNAEEQYSAILKSMEYENSELEECQKTLKDLYEESTLLTNKPDDNCWPKPDMNDEIQEKSSPWMTQQWLEAREELFLAALDLHRALIFRYKDKMCANLCLAETWLKGKQLPNAAAQVALDTLCLVVPVISTTFASTPRMFANIGCEGIGWLLIDEAGQALPQQAAGAIWRAKRTVVVGDPNQLEPVNALPVTIEGALARHYGDVRYVWWPSKSSVQRLADQTMDIGTFLPGGANDKIWVGCPLRVHRRCDEPMFSISNIIAYDGLMVQGKKQSESEWPKSAWIDVESETSEGHWIPAEGEKASKLIQTLLRQYRVGKDNIFLISPFRDCVSRLKKIAEDNGLNHKKFGTVHTTQGKEADIVILVLGGKPRQEGAKDWAAEKPNLLNVAVSRAKKRLYVIGNRKEWGKKQFFNVLASRLDSM